MTILEAAKVGAKWLRWWLDGLECECETVHICGRTEREAELRQMERVIKHEEDGTYVPSIKQICALCGHKGLDVLQPTYKVEHLGPLCHDCDRV
jgi:hypothetical protein